jgi:Hint domain
MGAPTIPSGTDITSPVVINGVAFGQDIIVNGTVYGLELSNYGSVGPGTLGNYGAAIYSSGSGNTLRNLGTVTGAFGESGEDEPAAGGVGVELLNSGRLENFSSITGGEGGFGNAGGAGVILSGSPPPLPGFPGYFGFSFNSSHIYGGAGGEGASGGTGVVLDHSSLFSNYYTIKGGGGGISPEFGVDAGNGGIGVDVESASKFTQEGFVYGGVGGAGSPENGVGGGGGGVGVTLGANSYMFTYFGAKTVGGGGGYGGTGGAGGAGVTMAATASLMNFSAITGGGGFSIASIGNGGIGGTGAQVAAGGTLLNVGGNGPLNTAAGTIVGGTGGLATDGVGGIGGTGVFVESSATAIGSLPTVINTGAIQGGGGGTGSFDVNETTGGNGGTGVLLGENANLLNAGVGYAITVAAKNGDVYTSTSAGIIEGGKGGNSPVGGFGGGGSGGAGGAGIFVDLATLTNEGMIEGGNGGTGSLRFDAGTIHSDPSSGAGGAGADLFGGVLTNDGTIIGGTGGAGAPQTQSPYESVVYYSAVYSGNGGVGVYLDGGTLISSGKIAGGAAGLGNGGAGNGTAGDAVQFGAVASTLEVDAGAVFTGAVVANSSVNDVLELNGTQSGGTPITLGTQFTGFQTLEFASGAAFSIDATSAAMSTLQTLDGFAAGDTIDITDSPYIDTDGYFNSVTNVLTIFDGGAPIRLTIGDLPSGKQFQLTPDTSGNGVDLTVGPRTGGLGTIPVGIVTQPIDLNGVFYGQPIVVSGIVTGYGLTNLGTVQPSSLGPNGAAIYGSGAGNTFSNQASVIGADGAGGVGDAGGAGVTFIGGSINNSGTILAGGGGSGGAGSNGSGGVGGELNGGPGANGQNGYNADAVAGAGGVGVDLTSAALTNSGAITGGSGGVGGAGGAGGAGGYGDTGPTGFNGGNGGNGGDGGRGGSGGAGVILTSGTLTNTGSITGGSGGDGGVGGANGAGGSGGSSTDGGANGNAGSSGIAGIGARGGYGGAGVYLDGGTLINSGTIVGGAAGVGRGGAFNGAAGAAVQFGAAPGTLEVDPGAVFTGDVIANFAVNDVLELNGTQSGGTPITLGTQFLDFLTLDFASGAAFSVDASREALSMLGKINGFSMGDTIDITDLAPAGATGSFNFVTDVLTITNGITQTYLAFDSDFAGEQFNLTPDAGGGTDLTLSTGVAILGALTNAELMTGADPIVTVDAGGSIAPAAAGAVGVDSTIANADLTNLGTITGGADGAGVEFSGGTLINAGTISAGSGNSNAIVFGGAASTLVVDPTAAFDGNVVGDGSDTLVLGGTTDPTLSGFGTQFSGFSELGFAPGAAWTVDSSTKAVDGANFHIDGFTSSDELYLSDFTLQAGATHSFNDGVLTIVDGTAGTFHFNFDNANGTNFFVAADASGRGTDITCACYRRGTRILAERGEVPIESLKIGDRVMTLPGIMRLIRWIGRRSYSGETAWGNRDVLPILIREGALGDGLPRRDLWVSPEHAMYLDGMLIPASLLVNGTSIVQEESVEEVTYLHLEFDSHAVIYAEGAASESFVDDESRQMFDNAAEYARLYPNAAHEPARFYAPRTEDGEELESMRQRLAARVAAMDPVSADQMQILLSIII